MWIIAKNGFVSLVQHNKDPNLIRARARRREHMEATFPGIDIEDLGLNAPDYRFHADIPRTLAANVMFEAVMAVDYDSHVKESVTGGHGKDADHVFYSAMMRCWTALNTLQERPKLDRDWWQRGNETSNVGDLTKGGGYGTLWSSLDREDGRWDDDTDECQACGAPGAQQFCPECGAEQEDPDDRATEDDEDRDPAAGYDRDWRNRIEPFNADSLRDPGAQIGGLAGGIAAKMTGAATPPDPDTKHEWTTRKGGHFVTTFGLMEFTVTKDGRNDFKALRNGEQPVRGFTSAAEARQYVDDHLAGKVRWGS